MKHERNMNEFFHCPFANVILEHCSYRSSFTNEFVHVSFMFDSFMNDFYLFHFYPSSFRERTKTPAFFRSCSMFVHLWTNECSFVLAVKSFSNKQLLCSGWVWLFGSTARWNACHSCFITKWHEKRKKINFCVIGECPKYLHHERGDKTCKLQSWLCQHYPRGWWNSWLWSFGKPLDASNEWVPTLFHIFRFDVSLNLARSAAHLCSDIFHHSKFQ